MKKTPFQHLTLLLAFAFVAGPLHALDPQAQQDAYSLGMAEADSAIVGGTHAISLNPAGVARANEPMAQLGLGTDTQSSAFFLNTSFLYPAEDGTVFAFSQFTDFPSQPYSETSYIGTVAMPLNSAHDLFFGLNLKLLAFSEPSGPSVVSGNGIGLDIGMAYDLRRSEGTIASFAFAIKDLSTQARVGNSYDVSVPRIFLLGAAYQNIPDTRIEADYEIVDQTLQNSALHNRLRFGVESFFSERQFSGRIGYDDPFDPDGYFTLGVGYHPPQPFEVSLALKVAPQNGDVSVFSSFVYRLGDLFKKSGPSVPESHTETSSTITLAPGEDMTQGATQVGKPVSGVPLRKMSIEVDPRVFSPAGKQKTTMVKFPGRTGQDVARWIVMVQAPDKKIVRKFGGSGGLLPGFLWDGMDDFGRPVPEGRYEIVLRTFNGKNEILSDDSQTVEVLLPRSRFEIAMANPYFSPTAKKGKNEVTLTVNSGGSSDVQGWDFEISDSSTQKVVHQQHGQGKLPKSLKWNGKDLSNKVANDGKYMALLTAQDRAGNNLKSDAVQFTLDGTPPELGLKVASTWLVPSKDRQKYSLSAADLAGIQSWTLTLADEDDNVLKEYQGSGQPPDTQEWDGTLSNGESVKPGALVNATLQATDRAGNQGESDPVVFQVDYQASNQEQLTLNLTTLYFNAQSSKLSDYSRKDLDKAAGSIKGYISKSILIVKGYASSSESGDLLTLSHARAVEVKKYLVKNMGVPEASVFAVGYADKEATKKGATPLSEDPDRRVVISLTTVH